MRFKKDEKARTPVYATEGSAGADLAVYEEITINSFESKKVDIGIHFEIPNGFFGMVVPRSSLFDKKGLILTNSVGIIDSDYRGSISMNLYNIKNEPVTLDYGTRIGQIIFIPYLRENFQQRVNLSETTRGSGGYGSTGDKEVMVTTVKYIESPYELPQNLFDLVSRLSNTIAGLQYTFKINSTDNDLFIDETFEKFSNKIDTILDLFFHSIGYAIKEKQNDKNNP